MNVNTVLLTGRVTKKPELRYTQGGVPVANFSIAQNEKSKDGKDRVQFIDCCAFSSVAENTVKILEKGMLTYVEGRLQISKYVDKNGQMRDRAQVVIKHFLTFDRKPPQGDQQPEGFPENEQPTLTSHEMAEEDLPW